MSSDSVYKYNISKVNSDSLVMGSINKVNRDSDCLVMGSTVSE